MSPDAATDAQTLSVLLDEVRALRAGLASDRHIWPRWMDLETASTYCSLSVKSLRRSIASGRIKAHKLVPGKLLLDRRELDAVIQAMT